jgi:hypothetical protein
MSDFLDIDYQLWCTALNPVAFGALGVPGIQVLLWR